VPGKIFYLQKRAFSYKLTIETYRFTDGVSVVFTEMAGYAVIIFYEVGIPVKTSFLEEIQP
jgi:hypothetical protein